MRVSLESYIGKDVDQVMDALKYSGYRIVHKVEEGSMVTMDLVDGRVRVWYHPETNLVSQITEG